MSKLISLIIQTLQRFGAVLTEHVGDPALTEQGENDPDDEYIFKRDMNWLCQADVVVAEVTTPSLGVGYEICTALNLNKAVICLYRPSEDKRLSAIIAGHPRLKGAIRQYQTTEEVAQILDQMLSGLILTKGRQTFDDACRLSNKFSWKQKSRKFKRWLKKNFRARLIALITLRKFIIKNPKRLTTKAKKIARQRLVFMKSSFERLAREIRSEV